MRGPANDPFTQLVRAAVAAELAPIKEQLAELVKACAAAGAEPSEALTVAEACQELRCSRSKLYSLISEGRLRSVRIGRRQLVRRADLLRLMEGAVT